MGPPSPPLLDFAQVKEIKPWDLAYHSEKLRMALYEFDEEELRPYFPAEKCLEGVFQTAYDEIGK